MKFYRASGDEDNNNALNVYMRIKNQLAEKQRNSNSSFQLFNM